MRSCGSSPGTRHGADQRHTLGQVCDELFTQARLRAEARESILGKPMIDAPAAAAAMGVSAAEVEALRSGSELLAVPSPGGGWLYPKFQFDSVAGDVPWRCACG